LTVLFPAIISFYDSTIYKVIKKVKVVVVSVKVATDISDT